MGLETSRRLVQPGSPPVLLALRIFYAWIYTSLVMTEPSLSSSLPDKSACDLMDCLDLFQAAQESLQIRYDSPVPRHHTLPPDDIRARCVALRTFFHCLQNLSSLCHGELGFHSSKKVIERQMKQINCTPAGPVFEPQHFPHPKEPVHPAICSFSGGSARRYCSIFGDPHMRTFGGVYQTCRIHGAWPLIDNEFFSVQITSETVGVAFGTAINKATVVIKRHDDCAHERYVTYQAMTHDLPGMFDDGQTSFGPADSVRLTEVIPNRHIEITLHYINTVLVLRQDGRFLSIGILVPEELANKTFRARSSALQLCSLGCSSGEQIHVAQSFFDSDNGGEGVTPRWHGAVSLADALRFCGGVTDYFLDSCVFDLLTTGDLNFTESALNAYSDSLRLYPEIMNELTNRTDLLNWKSLPAVVASSATAAAAGTNHRYLFVTTFVVLCCLAWLQTL